MSTLYEIPAPSPFATAFPSTESQLRVRLDNVATQIVDLFAKQRPGANAEDYVREVLDPSLEHVALENGSTLVFNADHADKGVERFGLVICCAYTAQAMLALQEKDIELAALLTIDAYYWLGMLLGAKQTREIEAEAIAKFCAAGPTAKNNAKYGKLKNLVTSLAMLRPIGPWKSMRAAAKLITPILLEHQEMLGQYLDCEEPEQRVYIWLGKMKNKYELFNIQKT